MSGFSFTRQFNTSGQPFFFFLVCYIFHANFRSKDSQLVPIFSYSRSGHLLTKMCNEGIKKYVVRVELKKNEREFCGCAFSRDSESC